MIYAAEVIDGLVIRVVVVPQETDGLITIGTENVVGIGWTYDDGVFVPPVYVEEE